MKRTGSGIPASEPISNASTREAFGGPTVRKAGGGGDYDDNSQ